MLTRNQTKVLRDMAERLGTDNGSILSMLHLLIGEVGGSEERTYDVHMQGVLRIIHQLGGLDSIVPTVATFTSL